jgi:glycosyltransferase involved in cell wall biosynthesis
VAPVRILHVGDDFAALRPCGLTLYSDALMQAQVAAGHEVSYVFSGRHYPRLERPRLKRWSDRGVRMLELVGSPIHTHWEAGTREPLRDLDEPAGEATFAAALREARPEVVHIHELLGLPTSLIEQAKAAGVPIVMTLHDYKPVCASVRLLDADGLRCTRLDVGEDCARNCAAAPAGRRHLVDWTLDYEMQRVKQRLPMGERLSFAALSPLVQAVTGTDHETRPAITPLPVTAPADYQRRRDVNIERLNLCNRLVAPSARVAEIYEERGVDPGRLTVQRLTLPHLEGLTVRRPAAVGTPLTFVTLGGCASEAKGSHAMAEAVQALERAGRGADYRLVVLGHVDDFARQALEPVPSVRLHGPYEPADLDRLLDHADVGILPSVWEEVHGFVGIEMLAKGLPVIANALGGIPEYVRDGETGMLNEAATGAGIAELMVLMIDDPAGVERLRGSVRARRAEIVRPLREHVAEVEALYAELASGGEPPRADQAATTRSPSARRPAS